MCGAQLVTGVRARLKLVMEWSRSPDARLHVSACGLLRGVMLESGEAVAREVQREALNYGVRAPPAVRSGSPPPPPLCWPPQAYLWHLRFAVATVGANAVMQAASRDVLILLSHGSGEVSSLLGRCFPAGLIHALHQPDTAAAPAPPAASPDSKSRKGGADSTVWSRAGGVPSVLAAPLSAEAGMGVVLGREGELWWDATLCARAKDSAHRTIADGRVKVRVLGPLRAAVACLYGAEAVCSGRGLAWTRAPGPDHG